MIQIIKKKRSSIKEHWRFFKQVSGLGGLPDFYIIGAQKSGTSSLYDCICQHPGIISRIEKEIHFFDNPTRRAKGIGYYKSHFSSPLYKKIVSKFIGYYPKEGEATPFLIHPWVPQWIYEATPNAKLILIVRNPVDRALSHYFHNVLRGREKLSFEDAIEQENDRILDDFQKLLKNPNHSAYNYLAFSYLSRGYYAQQLEWWLKYFSLDKIHIVVFEEFIENQEKILSQVFNFLEIPNISNIEYRESNSGNYIDGMSANQRKALSEHFRHHNERFFEMIRRRFDWII